MKTLKGYFVPLAIAVISVLLWSCKAKKLAVQSNPAPAPVVAEPNKETPPPSVSEVKKEESTPVAEKPDFNFNNIQFEFNSSVLKTPSYQELDRVAAEMKKFPSVKFNLSGHSSAEGTTEHNMDLSEQRAVAVKTYLSNSGVNPGNLVTKGYGETMPVASNDTEEGRELNRRVEIKKAE